MMEIIIIIFLIICLVTIIKLKSSVFDFMKNKTEHMTCDRHDTNSCIYDNMIVADKECIYGKKENNIMHVNEDIKYNKKEVSDLTDIQFKKYLIENVVDNSKGFIQSSSKQYIKKCVNEIDTSSINLNLKGIKTRYIRVISLDSSDWITNAKIQIYSKGIDISALIQEKQITNNSINIDINSEFEINKARVSANKSGNDKWVLVLIDKNGQIVFSELFTVIPNTPKNIDTQTPKKASVNIPLGCYNSASNINKYHGDNYNIKSCANKAKSNNHNYFRLENTNQCYTGSKYNIDNNSCSSGSNSRVFQVASDPVYEELGIQDVLVKKGSFRPSKNTLLGYVTLGVNYAISFNIKLESMKEYETQIFVVTSLSDNQPTSPGVNEPKIQSDTSEFSRIPGVWVCANSANINYAYSIRGNYNNLLSNCAKSLPINQDVNVIIIKTGTNFKIYMNTELIENIDKPDLNNNVKSTGRGAVYSSYNFEATPCTITNFMYVSSNKPISIDSLNTIKKNENIEIDKKRSILFRQRTLINDNILEKMGTSAKKINLLYKGTSDGFSAKTFHSLCNNKGPTITVISANSRISGGYTPESWGSRNNWVNVASGDAFLFTIENGNVNKYYNTKSPQHTMYDHQSYGPTFGGGHDLYISDNANANGSSYSNPYSYTIPSNTTLFGAYNFRLVDIEVYSTDVLPTSNISKFLVSNNIFTKLGVNISNSKPLYNSKKDGFSPNTYHSLCDNKGPIIIFVRANNRISGGYLPISVKSVGQWVNVTSGTAYLFTTDANGNINKYYNDKHSQYTVYDGSGYYPVFGAGHDLYISSDNIAHSNPHSYSLPSNTTLFGSTNLKVDEIEVYSVQTPSKFLFSINNPSIPTLSLTNFPKLGNMSTWEMNINFNVTGQNSNWRALIGDMYNNNNNRGWGVWLSPNNNIHFSWQRVTWDANPQFNVQANTNYNLKINMTSTSLTLLLTNLNTNTTKTAVNNSIVNYVMTTNGPVTIGGWINYSGERFPGTISSINVSSVISKSVTVYEHCNYQGKSLELGVGTHYYSFINSKGFNDIISSIKVPSGLKAVAFEHDPYQGRQWTFTSDNECIVNLGANDTISSIIVSEISNVVTVYEHCNYQGKSLELGVGTHNYSFINSKGFNDIISSIKVPSGLKAVAFEHDPHQGRQWTFTSDNECIVNLGANDTISSVIVSKV
jgi:hypothetical protein